MLNYCHIKKKTVKSNNPTPNGNARIDENRSQTLHAEREREKLSLKKERVHIIHYLFIIYGSPSSFHKTHIHSIQFNRNTFSTVSPNHMFRSTLLFWVLFGEEVKKAATERMNRESLSFYIHSYAVHIPISEYVMNLWSSSTGPAIAWMHVKWNFSEKIYGFWQSKHTLCVRVDHLWTTLLRLSSHKMCALHLCTTLKVHSSVS